MYFNILSIFLSIFFLTACQESKEDHKNKMQSEKVVSKEFIDNKIFDDSHSDKHLNQLLIKQDNQMATVSNTKETDIDKFNQQLQVKSKKFIQNIFKEKVSELRVRNKKQFIHNKILTTILCISWKDRWSENPYQIECQVQSIPSKSKCLWVILNKNPEFEAFELLQENPIQEVEL